MVYRARDVCTAAFDDDLTRLAFLVLQGAPGGVANEEEEPLEDEAQEAAIDADEAMVRVRAKYTLPDPAEAEEAEEEEEPPEEEEAEEEDAEAEAEEKDAGGPADDDERAVFDYEAEAEAQEADMELYRRLVRRRLRDDYVTRVVNSPGLIRTGASAANLRDYGVLFRAEEQWESPGAAAAAATAAAKNSSTAATADGPSRPSFSSVSGVSGGGSGGAGGGSVPAIASIVNAQTSVPERLALRVTWKPSKRSPFAATPLHWAVLGRAHAAIDFLLRHGADLESDTIRAVATQAGGAGALQNSPGSFLAPMLQPPASPAAGGDDNNNDNDGSGNNTSKRNSDSEQHTDFAPVKFPGGLTPMTMAVANRSMQTAECLRAGAAARAKILADAAKLVTETEARLAARVSRMEAHKAFLKERREARQRLAAARRERRAARQKKADDDAAAAAAADGAEGDEEDDDDNDDY